MRLMLKGALLYSVHSAVIEDILRCRHVDVPSTSMFV